MIELIHVIRYKSFDKYNWILQKNYLRTITQEYEIRFYEKLYSKTLKVKEQERLTEPKKCKKEHNTCNDNKS